jgi:hypothetical protein
MLERGGFCRGFYFSGDSSVNRGALPSTHVLPPAPIDLEECKSS